MMSILISVGLSLIALAAGMFLLAKTKKDNLGLFYTIISFFIIVSTFISLACAALNTTMKIYSRKHAHGMMMGKNFMQDGWKNNYGNYNYDNSWCGKEGCRMSGCGMNGCERNGCCMAGCGGQCSGMSKCNNGKDSCK